MNRRDLRVIGDPSFPYRATTPLDMGKDLRDAALEQSKQGREARIEMIRNLLSKKSWADPATHLDPPEAYEFCGELTADDVWEAAAELGLTEGDTRWLGSVLRSWSLVMNTGHYTPSRRKVNHARPIPVFRWV